MPSMPYQLSHCGSSPHQDYFCYVIKNLIDGRGKVDVNDKVIFPLLLNLLFVRSYREKSGNGIDESRIASRWYSRKIIISNNQYNHLA